MFQLKHFHMKHNCEKEQQWGSCEEKLKAFSKHVEESERQGGYRDRLSILEGEIKQMKANWRLMFLGAFVGGLLGKAAPDLVNWVSHLIK